MARGTWNNGPIIFKFMIAIARDNKVNTTTNQSILESKFKNSKTKETCQRNVIKLKLHVNILGYILKNN